MKTTSLEILEKASLPTTQSHAILKVMELEMAAATESLATKADIVRLEVRLEAEISQLEAEIRAFDGRIDGRIGAAEGRLTRWVLTCILGQTAVLAGLGYFFLSHFSR